jgi:hypothetical protein
VSLVITYYAIPKLFLLLKLFHNLPPLFGKRTKFFKNSSSEWYRRKLCLGFSHSLNIFERHLRRMHKLLEAFAREIGLAALKMSANRLLCK